jgi:hypothetical protein
MKLETPPDLVDAADSLFHAESTQAGGVLILFGNAEDGNCIYERVPPVRVGDHLNK